MAPNMNGKFKHEKSEGLDDFLKAMGIGAIARTAAKSSSPTVTITQDGDNFTIKTAAMKTNEVSFTVGQNFTADDPLSGGKKSMSSRWDGDRLITAVLEADKEGRAPVTIREVVGDELIQTIEVKGVKAVRRFKRA